MDHDVAFNVWFYCVNYMQLSEKEKSFSRLNVNSVSDAYKASKNRVIILDLNGTVIERETAGKYLKGEFFGAVGNKSRENVSHCI